MRIVCAFTAQYHPLARASHEYLPGLERVDVSGRNDSYQELLRTLWDERDAFILIEHDVEINDRAVKQAKHCACLWGISPYNGPGLDPLYGSLGFVRFRSQLMEEVPDLFNAIAALNDSQDIAQGHWRRLDSRILGVLRGRGYEPHIHDPVLQHHVFRDQCSCMTEHEAFPIDGEGRFRP